MFKLNKTTHLMILFTFAIVFVVFYLYYTINDVKRLSSDVRKLSTDVSKLNQDLTNIIGSLGSLKNDVPAGVKVNPLVVPISVPVVEPQVEAVVGTKGTELVLESDSEDEDDGSSVNTDELKKIITENDIEDEQEQEPETTELEQHSDPEPEVESDPVQELLKEGINFKNLKYEELKDLCKKNSLSTKGTKDQLISRLESI